MCMIAQGAEGGAAQIFSEGDIPPKIPKKKKNLRKKNQEK